MKRWAALAAVMLLMVCSAAYAQPLKAAYLTFDDGPNSQTPELLAVLEELGVPATFFLVGANVAERPEEAKMILDAGHAVGCHTMYHSYSKLKESTDYVKRDIGRFMDAMHAVDPSFTTDLYRFPGGSTSYASKTKRFVRDLGFAWFDWDVSNGDAKYKFGSDEKQYDFTVERIDRAGDVIILLMHEGKPRTRSVLPAVVAYLREAGYEFRRLSAEETEREILERSRANMMFPDKREETSIEGGM